jgi:class 3 adenylate cyclase
MGIRAFIDQTECVIYHAKQADDNLVRGHTVLLVMCSEESLSTGAITFLFTDIEGSTELWENAPRR